MRITLTALSALTLLVAAGPRAALAAPPVADPGFVYVDYNNDGLYSTDHGDIGATSGVDIHALILNDGVFDTQRSEGNYRAPCRDVSLVVPASQSSGGVGALSVTLPLKLKAGKNLLVYGEISAPSIRLEAGGRVDMTKSVSVFDTFMSVSTGSSGYCGGGGGDILLNGAAVTGIEPTSELWVAAGRSVFANPTSEGFATALLTGALISVDADYKVYMDGAAFLTLEPGSTICVSADRDVQGVNFTAMFADGLVKAKSCRGGVALPDAAMAGSPISVFGACQADVTRAALFSAGSAYIQSCGKAIADAANMNVGSLSMSGNGGVDIMSAAVMASSGTVTLQSCGNRINVSGSSVQAAGGFSAWAYSSITATNAQVAADNFIKFYSERSRVTADNSTVNAFSSSPNTYIHARGSSTVNVNGANWLVPYRITLRSEYSNVTAVGAALQSTRPDGLVRITANGGTIDLTGAIVSTPNQFGPPGVNVIGP